MPILLRFATAVLLFVLTLSVPALADEPDYQALANVDGATEEAQIHFQLATRYYTTGRFSSAADEFRISYELSGRIELLYNAFLAHREAMELDEAVEAGEAFIAGTTDEGHRQNAEARLARVRELQAQLSAVPPDDGPVEPESPRTDLVATEPVETEPYNEDETASAAPWIVAGAGGAIALASIVPGVLALGDNADLDELCASGPCTGEADAIQVRGQRRATLSDVMLFGGLAIAAGGVIWGLVTRRSSDTQGDDNSVRAGAACSATGCTTHLSGAF